MANTWQKEAEDTAKKYADAIKQESQYLIDQQNKARDNSLASLENQRLSAINTLNNNKDTIRQAALDNAKQANINRMLALKDNNSAMSRAGLSTQGIVGSQVNSINNNYGTNLNSILKDKVNSLNDIDNQINDTNLQYNTNRLNTINNYDNNIASLQNTIDQQALNQYNTIYSQVIAQKQQELENEARELERQRAIRQQEYENKQAEIAREEAIRQWEAEMAYKKQRDIENDKQSWAQINSNNYGFNDSFGGGTTNNNGSQIKTNYYSGNINPDTQYGTFETKDLNGVKYQPNNVNGYKLSSSGKTVSQVFGKGAVTGSTGANMDGQKIWKTANDKYYIWDGSQNKYVDITNMYKSGISGSNGISGAIGGMVRGLY